MHASPTVPRPKTAAESPFWTRAVFLTAPRPVETPQPRRQRRESGGVEEPRSVGTTATETSWTTQYWEKVDVPC